MTPDEAEQTYAENLEKARKMLAQAQAKSTPHELTVIVLAQSVAIAALNLKVHRLERQLEELGSGRVSE